MITILEQENQLLIYQDDKLIATDNNQRLFVDNRQSKLDIVKGVLDTTISLIIERAIFYQKNQK